VRVLETLGLRRMLVRRFARREARPAVVDARLDVLVPTDAETGKRYIGCGYTELEGAMSAVLSNGQT